MAFWLGRWLLLWRLIDFVSGIFTCAALWANSGCMKWELDFHLRSGGGALILQAVSVFAVGF